MNRGRILSHAPRYYFALFLIALFFLLTSSQLIAQGEGGEPPFTPPEPPALPLLSLAAAPVTINQFPAPTTPLTVTITNLGTGPAQAISLQMDGGLLTLPISQNLGTLEAGQSLTATLPLELLGYAVGDQSLLLTTEAINLTNPVQAVATLTLLEPDLTNPLAAPGLNGEDGQTEKGEEGTGPEFHLLQVQRPLTGDYRGRILTFTLHNSPNNTQDLTLALSQWLPGLTLSPESLQLHYLPDAPKEGQPGQPSLIAFRYDPYSMTLNFASAGDGQYLMTSGHQGESMSGGSPDDPQGWVPTFNQPTTSLFTGSASYQYPLLTPPGPGLFQPTLALNYSGAAGNGLAGRPQNDAVGFGWNMSGNIDISQAVTICPFDAGKLCPANAYLGEDNEPHSGIIELTLSIGGTGYELTHVDGTAQNGYPGRYILKGNTSFYVEYCRYTPTALCLSAESIGNNGDSNPTDGAATATTSKGFWVIKDSQNTLYRLGYTTLSEQELQHNIANSSQMGTWEGTNSPGHALRWRVDRVEDRFEIVSRYTYSETLPSEHPAWSATIYDGHVRAPASYLMKIEYGFNQILFDYELLGPTYGAPPSYPDPLVVSWQTNILARVEIRSKDYETGSGDYLVRAYIFSHLAQRHGHNYEDPNSGISQQTEWCRGHYTAYWDWRLALLSSITELDSTGQAKVRVNNVNKADVEFAYWWHKTGYWAESGNYARYCAPYLTQLHTPYNPGIPVATFTYNEAANVYHNYNAPAGTTTWLNTIASQTLNGGWTTDAPPQTSQFSYANPHYGGKARTDQWGSYAGAFQGFQDVTRTLMSGSSPHNLELNHFLAYDFNADGVNNNRTLTGMMDWQERRTPPPGNLVMARSEENWTTQVGTIPGTTQTTRLPIRTQTIQYGVYYAASSSHNVGTRTEYTYDNYGNPAQVREYGGTVSGGTPYRVQETLYVHNTSPSNWLIGLPWRVTMWNGEPNPADPSKIISRQRTRYDGASCTAGGSQVPVNGLVTASDVYVPGGGSGHCPDFLTTPMSYGLFGNLWWQPSQTSPPTGVATFPTVQYNSQWIYWRNHSSIEKVSNPLGETLYGFNDTHTPWLFTDKTAPNGAKSRYEYDNFGRLIKQYTPNASTGLATVWSQQIIYKDNAPWGGDYGNDPAMPLYIDTITVPGQPYSSTSRTFYDALGRVRQQRSWNLASDLWGPYLVNKVVTETEYNNLGQVICQTTPIYTNQITYNNTTLHCLANDHTTTSYTRSGSPAITTGIDGLTSSGLTLGRTSLSVDPIGRLSASNQDLYGRLKSVEEINITHNPFTNPGFDTSQWAITTGLGQVINDWNGQSVLRVGKAGTGGGTYAASHNSGLSAGSSVFFRFQLSGDNQSSRIMLRASDGSASLRLELYNGQIYPQYTTSTAGNGTATAVQIAQVANAWYRAQISLDKNGQPTWRVWREDGIGDPDKQFTWTVTDPAVLNVLKTKTWNFILAPGTAGSGTAYLYLGAYQEGKQYITQYAYDKADNLTQVTDAVGNMTTLTYDKLGRKLTMSDPDMGSWTYAYDLAGNLIRQTDANQQRLCFYYDNQNRLTSKTHNGTGTTTCPAAPGGTTLASYTYHSSGMGRGQVATIAGTNNGVTFNDSFSYDYRGRVTSTGRTIAGSLYTLGTGYDLLDRPTTLTYPGGEVVTTTYDKQVANSLHTSNGNTMLVSNVTYNHRLEMTGVVLNNGLTQDYTYSPASGNYRLQSAFTRYTATPNVGIWNRGYQYDPVGNITQIVMGVTGQGPETQTFTYDSLGRLKTAKAVGGPAQYDHSSLNTDYDYDAIGNMVSLAGSTAYTYTGWPSGCIPTYPAPTQALPHAVKQKGSDYYCYDKNGNMTKRVEGGTTYNQTFDVENRLKTVSMTGNSTVTNFAYDASGQRLRTEVAPSGSPVANDTRTFTIYPFPGYEVEQTDTWLYQCPSEVNCLWMWTFTSTVTRKTYFLGGQAVATRVESTPTQGGDGFYYLHSDHLGSTGLLTNSSGVKVTGSETRYYPYGSQRLAPTAPADNITDRDFTGQKDNLELGLLYYNARFYVPGLGRFLTADTIVPDATYPQSYNRYSYVYNSPTAMVDPSGHLGICFQQGQNADDITTALTQMCEELANQGLFGPNKDLFKVFESSPEGAKAALEWLNEILAQDQYANEEIFLLGFSYGGAAAIEFAWLLNDMGGKSYHGVDVPNRRVSGLIMIDPVSSFRDIKGWLIYAPYSSSGSSKRAYTVPDNVDFALNLYATDDVLPLGCVANIVAPDCGIHNVDGALNVAMTGTNHCSIGYETCIPGLASEYVGWDLGPFDFEIEQVYTYQGAPPSPNTINMIRIYMTRNARHGYRAP